MRTGRGITWSLALLIGGALGIVAAGQGFIGTTSAAWSDQVNVTATATAGTWQTPTTGSTCIAYGQNGAALAGCKVSRIDYFGWGPSGNQTRNYYLSFATPLGTRSVSFDVDLTGATGNGGSWSWERAGVLAGAQFSARDGWNCGQLPRVRGTGADWQTTTVFFQVVEKRNSAGMLCS
ncbi:hypothetical protein [Microbacterium sp. GXF0217]